MKAIVFDWDLTLWNSWDLHLRLMRQTADALGLSRPDGDEVARQFSRPFAQHLEWFFGGDQQRLVDTYLGFYRESIFEGAGLYPEVKEMLTELGERGYRLAVFSDKQLVFGESELAQSGVAALFDYALFLAEGRPYKPDPEGLFQVLEALGSSPSDTLYVGDSRQDVECAHRAGVNSGAALWASIDRKQLLAPGPRYRWERVDQILDTLGAQPA